MDRYVFEEFLESLNYDINIPTQKYHMGFHVGPGLQYHFRNGRAFHVQSTYQTVFDMLTVDRSMKYKSFTLQAGMTINK